MSGTQEDINSLSKQNHHISGSAVKGEYARSKRARLPTFSGAMTVIKIIRDCIMLIALHFGKSAQRSEWSQREPCTFCLKFCSKLLQLGYHPEVMQFLGVLAEPNMYREAA